MPRTPAKVLWLVLICLVSVAGWAEANGHDTGITLTITPIKTFCGGAVTINGATAPDARSGNRMVTARFIPPRGESLTRKFRLADDMTYEFTLSPLTIAGNWKVKVQGPVAQLGSTEGTFVVQAAAAFASTSVQGLGQAMRDAAEFNDDAYAMVADFTTLPDKDTALDKIQEVGKNFIDLGEAFNGAAVGFDRIADAMVDLVMFPGLTTSFGQISQRLQEQIQQLEEARRQLQDTREEMNSAREHCRRFHFQKYGFHLCSRVLSVAFTPGTTLGCWARGQFKDAVQNVKDRLADEAAMALTGMTPAQIARARAAIANVDKGRQIVEAHLDPEKDFSSLRREAIFGGLDWLIDWVYTKVGRNCRMYQADITGKLRIDYYAKGMVYMVARYPVTGEMKVFFKKRENSSDIVTLKGQVQGSFGWRTGKFYPERTCMDVPGMTGMGFCVPRPPFADFLDFVILMEGRGRSDGIELEFTEATSDIERLHYMFCSVLWSPYQVVPTVDFPKMDVPGAWWFFTRVTATAGRNRKFTIPLTVDGDTVRLDYTFRRVMNYVRKRGFKATLTWKIKGKEDGI